MAGNEESSSLKPCNTKSMAASQAVSGDECPLKICSTKRKVPADGHDEEDTVLADSDSVTTEQAIKVAGADSEVDSSDDDDEPVSEVELRQSTRGSISKGFCLWSSRMQVFWKGNARLNLFSNPTDIIKDLLGLPDFELRSQYNMQDKK